VIAEGWLGPRCDDDRQSLAKCFVQETESKCVRDADRELVDCIERGWRYHEGVRRWQDVVSVWVLVGNADRMAGDCLGLVSVEEPASFRCRDHACVPALGYQVGDVIDRAFCWTCPTDDQVEHCHGRSLSLVMQDFTYAE